MYCHRSLKRYLDDLAAKLPAPGGGSAAAMTAALGASLLSMVANFTLGKPKYAQYEPEMRVYLRVSEAARNEFLELVDLDVVAYKSKDMKASLAVPLRICRLCVETAALCAPLVKQGNRNLASDVAVAAVLLESAFFSALCNVDINLKFIGDKKLTGRLRKELARAGKNLKGIRLKTEVDVGKIIGG